MRIAVDSSVLRRPHTGVARYVEGLAGALSQRQGTEVLMLPGPRRVGNGFAFRPMNLSLQRWWYEVGMARRARALQADVMLMPSGYACRRGRIPQLAVLHDVNFLTRPGTYERAFARYAGWVTARAIRDADQVVTDSRFSRSEIARHMSVEQDRIAVVYPGIEPAPDAWAAPPLDRPYALYLGSTEKHKNVGLLLDAWEGRATDLALAIVGSPGRDHANLVERARRMGSQVVITGRVGSREIEAWYRGARVFLFPSLAEGFGIPPLEAMLRGVPVVASREGSLPEMLGDAARYHSADDPSELMARVLEVENDASVRRQMVAAGLARASQFTWARAAEEIAGLLERLIHD